jgi:hypothetical protein
MYSNVIILLCKTVYFRVSIALCGFTRKGIV